MYVHSMYMHNNKTKLIYIYHTSNNEGGYNSLFPLANNPTGQETPVPPSPQ